MATYIRPIVCAALLAASGGTALAQDDAFDLKGIRFGATEADIRAKFPKAMCRETKNRELGDRSCYVHQDTYGGAKASLLYFLSAGAVTGGLVKFSSADFDAVAEALTVRFGKPSKVETGTVQNRMGATFENSILTWKRESAQLKAERRAGSIDEALVSLHSDKALATLGERSVEASKKRAGDL